MCAIAYTENRLRHPRKVLLDELVIISIRPYRGTKVTSLLL